MTRIFRHPLSMQTKVLVPRRSISVIHVDVAYISTTTLNAALFERTITRMADPLLTLFTNYVIVGMCCVCPGQSRGDRLTLGIVGCDDLITVIEILNRTWATY